MHARPRIARELLIATVATLLIGCTPVAERGVAEPVAAPGPGTAHDGAETATIIAVAPATPKILALPPGPRFDHPGHTEREVECADCHVPGAPVEEWAEDMFDTCMICHEDIEEEFPAEKKIIGTFWSPDGEPLWQRGSTPLGSERIFAHESHSDLDCADCHGDMSPAARRGGPALTMDQCVDCHETRSAPTSCSTCHKEIDEDSPPPSHNQLWTERHGPLVNAAGGGLPTDCRMCHKSEEDCTTCHQNTKPASHQQQQNWMQRHGPLVNAAGGGLPTDCRMCHTSEDNCTTCHQNTKPRSHQQRWLQRHGPLVNAAGGGLPTDCRLCHTSEDNCTTCHQSELPPSHEQLWMQRHGRVVMAAGGGLPTDCRLCHSSEAFCTTCHQDEVPDNHTSLFRTRTHGAMVSLDRTRCMVCHETDSCQQCHEATPPRSHRGQWASRRNSHCASCHLPVSSEGQCRTCHQENPVHLTAPDQPSWHEPGFNCRLCHSTFGTQGARPLRHVDNGLQCQLCHR